jgi:hypothetical protein
MLGELLRESRRARSFGMTEQQRLHLLESLRNALVDGCLDLRKAAESEIESLQAFSATAPTEPPPSTILEPPAPLAPPKTADEIARIQTDVDYALRRGRVFEIDRFPDRARRVYQTLIGKYPNDPMIQPVRDALEALQKDPN